MATLKETVLAAFGCFEGELERYNRHCHPELSARGAILLWDQFDHMDDERLNSTAKNEMSPDPLIPRSAVCAARGLHALMFSTGLDVEWMFGQYGRRNAAYAGALIDLSQALAGARRAIEDCSEEDLQAATEQMFVRQTARRKSATHQVVKMMDLVTAWSQSDWDMVRQVVADKPEFKL